MFLKILHPLTGNPELIALIKSESAELSRILENPDAPPPAPSMAYPEGLVWPT